MKRKRQSKHSRRKTESIDRIHWAILWFVIGATVVGIAHMVITDIYY